MPRANPADKPVLINLDPAAVERFSCCGVGSPAHEGRRRKTCWMQANFPKGLRAKVLVTSEGRQAGFIEYIPGEHAWRGVEARGYLVIHCVWIHIKQLQGKGLASLMVEACVEDARTAGMDGVAVVTRGQPWLAGPALYLANGFTVAASAPPDYLLLVRKLNPAAKDPAFKGGWERKLQRYRRGLTIIRSDQCPYIAKFAGEIVETAEAEYGIKPRIVELRTAREAQDAPTPYAVFAVIHNGRVLADHQISRTRFRNIMEKLPVR